MSNVEKLVNRLNELGYTITTAESCTGGMISSALVDVSGASSVVNECHITYSNDAKIKYLNVKKETLEQYGAVSEETAYEMAVGARLLADLDVAIAVTGVAGPTGGTKDKPVGLVYIACNVGGDVTVTKNMFSGNRTQVRTQTTECSINNMLELLR